MSGQRAKDVEDAPVNFQAFEHFTGVIVPVHFNQGFKARFCQAHEFSYLNIATGPPQRRGGVIELIIHVELTYYGDRAYHMPDLRSHSKSYGEVVHVALSDALK